MSRVCVAALQTLKDAKGVKLGHKRYCDVETVTVWTSVLSLSGLLANSTGVLTLVRFFCFCFLFCVCGGH